MASKAVEQDVAERDASDGSGVEPKKHPNVVGRPKVVDYPLDKALVQERFVEDVDNVSSEERPRKNVQICHTHILAFQDAESAGSFKREFGGGAIARPLERGV
jgi:hypothetical protein